MEKLRDSNWLKIACYMLIPILVAIFIFSVFHLVFLNEYGDIESGTKYIESEQFANDYFYNILNKIQYCVNEENGRSTNFVEIKEEDGNSYYYMDARYDGNYYLGISSQINFIMIDKATNKMFTNVKSQDYEQEMQNMQNHEIYWNYTNGEVTTNLEHINQENIKYNYSYTASAHINDYDIYTSCDAENGDFYTAYGMNQALYEYMLENKQQPVYAITLSSIFLIIIAIYLFWSIGHKEGKEGIDLNTIDHIPYEILTIIGLTIISISLSILVNIGEAINYVVLFVGTICYLICYAVCGVIGVTTIKRLKAKSFLKSFLIYKILRWCYRKIKNIVQVMKEKTPEKRKLFWYYLLFLGISIILASSFMTGIGIILLIGFWIWVYYQMKKYVVQQEKIKLALKNIYEGKTDIRLNENELEGVLKQMAIYINDIAGGFSNAIEKSLKSERLKTELITNVSHDIKTPLTSIINYVDLLKKEDVQDEKIKEYIEILDQKSQRLKKLIEDLVEASKVSSGNVQLNLEEIKVKELLNQTIGEFKDRFEEKNLEVELQIPEEEIKVKADSRYLYRIIENLFSNITKYALEGSRVYIDVTENKDQFTISMKNISKDKLNISSDELMQRFVRGDKSRYTEGSGLGLSIAKSLTELQKGKFSITIDGDLFKVEMQWKKG